jgi:hypothetical protein
VNDAGTAVDKLPGPRGPSQFGYLRRLLSDPQPVLEELRDRYGSVFGMGAGPMRVAVVGDPAALAALFATSTDSFRWGHKYNVLGFVVGSSSLIVSDGADHKRRRSSVQVAFSRRRLNGWIPTIVEQTDAAIDGLASRLHGRPDALDLAPMARSLVLAVTVRAFFGDRFAAQAEEIGELFRRPQAYLESPAVRQLPHPFPATARARVRADRRALDAIIDTEIAALRRAPSDDPHDVLASLVADGSMSDHEIRDQVVTLIGTGFDTTTASLTWALWCLALAPDVMAALRIEADEVLGRPGQAGSPDGTSLSRLDLAGAAMRETVRLHPAGVISPREAVVDVQVGPFVIRRGTLILWSAHLAGRDPDTWPDPSRFDPSRFVDPTPEQTAAQAAAWVPFGRGARNCIGFALAQMELTLMMSRLTQRLNSQRVPLTHPRPSGWW